MSEQRIGGSEPRGLGDVVFDAPMRRRADARCSGQATTEMVVILPLILGVIGGCMFIVYCCWQGIKVQQGANLAARIQGEERVSGGVDENSIQTANGVGVNMSLSNGDEDPTQTNNPKPVKGSPSAASVYGEFRQAVLNMFSTHDQSQVYVPPPVIGQNVDQVKVVRVINVPTIPFLKLDNAPKQIDVQGTAWGGEDTFMYGLPRWGQTANTGSGSTNSEWRQMVGNDSSQQHD